MAKNKKMSDLEVAHKVESEGLDYAITAYMGPEDIANPELAKLWEEAEIILNKIQGILDDALEDAESE